MYKTRTSNTILSVEFSKKEERLTWDIFRSHLGSTTRARFEARLVGGRVGHSWIARNAPCQISSGPSHTACYVITRDRVSCNNARQLGKT